ncbi:MAG TPA: CGNR zinc finger domain-containing protein [Hyphomicrobium sp.]|nr:CGNR zinc finger domain-containing protein [Hyphomicrobium sp.]
MRRRLAWVSKGRHAGQPDHAPVFLANATALDFLNALAPPPAAKTRPLRSGADFLHWLERAELVCPSVARYFRERDNSFELDTVAEDAKRLGNWFREFVSKYAGRRLCPSAVEELAPLNTILKQDTRFGQIAQTACAEPKLFWQFKRHFMKPQDLLFPVANAMAEMLCKDELAKVKVCEASECTLLFLDRTRGGKRRWCSMSSCGNRAKQQLRRTLPKGQA